MNMCLICGKELHLINDGKHLGCVGCGSAYRADITDRQHKILTGNAHLTLASRLEDGDILILDTGHAENYPIGPYILTRDGKVQDVNYHYRIYHNRG